MKLRKTSAQAALAMGLLARQETRAFIHASQIAKQLEMPTDSALKILQTLARHHLIESQLGRGGGYRLCKPPCEVTLLQVIEAMNGPICGRIRMQTTPASLVGAIEQLGQTCQKAAQAIREQFATMTIADLQHAH